MTRNSFYGVPKERLANLIPYPSTFEVNGDLSIRYASGRRRGKILLSDYVMPGLLGPRPQAPYRYVPIGTRAEMCAATLAELNAMRAMLDRVAKRLEV